jgi:hypothetical protein
LHCVASWWASTIRTDEREAHPRSTTDELLEPVTYIDHEHVSSILKQIAALQVLLEAGGDAEARDAEGVTASERIRNCITWEKKFLRSRVYKLMEELLEVAWDREEFHERQVELAVCRDLFITLRRELDGLNKTLDTRQQGKRNATLRCSTCGKDYSIGDNAVAVSMEYGLSLAKGSIMIGSQSPNAEDLISSIDDLPTEAREATLERGRESWNHIEESLAGGDRRRWCCRACNAVNSYPSPGL